jgi:hypothetical protein
MADVEISAKLPTISAKEHEQRINTKLNGEAGICVRRLP